jgi:cytoskeletal protein RodZ
MKELADTLKSERLARGVTLEEMFQRVRVSVPMLKALEEGRFERIGAPLLIRSFVRSYCTALNLDAESLLSKYETEIRRYDRQKEGLERYRRCLNTMHGRGRRRLAWITLFSLLVGTVYGGIWVSERQEQARWMENNRDHFPPQEYPADLSGQGMKVSVADQEWDTVLCEESRSPAGGCPSPRSTVAALSRLAALSSEVENAPQVAELPQPLVGSVDPLPAVMKPGNNGHVTEVLADDRPLLPDDALNKHRLALETVEKTWVQVRIDDQKTYSVMLHPGDRREWEARETVHIVLGNAGGVLMKWDDRPVNTGGKSGQVLKFRLPDVHYLE